ncbi:unnamed protein product [Cochlearia groenlandica]
MAQDTQEQGTTPQQSPVCTIPHIEPVPDQSHPPGSTARECTTTSYPQSPIQTDVDISEQDSTPVGTENIHMDTDTHAPITEEESSQLHNRSWLLSDELEAISTPSGNHLLGHKVTSPHKDSISLQDKPRYIAHLTPPFSYYLPYRKSNIDVMRTQESAAAIKHVDIQAPQLPTKESSTNANGWKECMADIGKQVDNILSGSTSNAENNIHPTLVINSSPTHQIPRNIPTTLEVQLATLLQSISDPPPSDLTPHINCEDYALLEAVLKNNPTT